MVLTVHLVGLLVEGCVTAQRAALVVGIVGVA
jgi:hypothetical protein